MLSSRGSSVFIALEQKPERRRGRRAPCRDQRGRGRLFDDGWALDRGVERAPVVDRDAAVA